ncbi:MAG: hypothetical protein OXB84_05250, partial [Halobacteriovoraceae bacterium]|nr:hypothetical protein [Halobacteriovoraceae bacterium]
KVVISDTEPAVYGILVASSACNKGKVLYEIFDEKLSTELFDEKSKYKASELAKGIAFPINVDKDGNSISTRHQIFFKKEATNLQEKIVFDMRSEGDVVELCALIANY